MAEDARRNAWALAVASDPNLPPAAASVAIYLAFGCSNPHLKPVFPGLPTIAEKSGSSEAVARRAIRGLAAGGFLRIEPGGGARANLYHFLLPDRATVQDEPKRDAEPLSRAEPLSKMKPLPKTNETPAKIEPDPCHQWKGPLPPVAPEPLNEPQIEPQEEPLSARGRAIEEDELPFGSGSSSAATGHPEDPGAIDWSDADATFAAFWSRYPIKEGKDRARKAWAQAIAKADPATIIRAAEAYRAMQAARHRDPAEAHRFTKRAAGWLDDERWNDPAIDPARLQSEPLGMIARPKLQAAAAKARRTEPWSKPINNSPYRRKSKA